MSKSSDWRELAALLRAAKEAGGDLPTIDAISSEFARQLGPGELSEFLVVALGGTISEGGAVYTYGMSGADDQRVAAMRETMAAARARYRENSRVNGVVADTAYRKGAV
jgi:hypothetical protein